MPVYALVVGSGDKVLAQSTDLSSFSFFQRPAVGEALAFFAQTALSRTQGRATIAQNQYTGHVYVRNDGLGCVIVCDDKYDKRAAFSVVGKIADEFATLFPPSKYNQPISYPQLAEYLVKAQNPASNDPFMRVQRELDETKVILHKTMESLLQRGEKLDDLVQKSDQLSQSSKMFYKQAQKTNACCTYI